MRKLLGNLQEDIAVTVEEIQPFDAFAPGFGNNKPDIRYICRSYEIGSHTHHRGVAEFQTDIARYTGQSRHLPAVPKRG